MIQTTMVVLIAIKPEIFWIKPLKIREKKSIKVNFKPLLMLPIQTEMEEFKKKNFIIYTRRLRIKKKGSDLSIEKISYHLPTEVT